MAYVLDDFGKETKYFRIYSGILLMIKFPFEDSTPEGILQKMYTNLESDVVFLLKQKSQTIIL